MQNIYCSVFWSSCLLFNDRWFHLFNESSHFIFMWMDSCFEFHQQQNFLRSSRYTVPFCADFLLPTLNFVIVLSRLLISNKLKRKMFSNLVFSFRTSTADVLINPLPSMIIYAAASLAKHNVFESNSRRKNDYFASLSSIYNPSFHNCRFFFIFCLVTVLSQIVFVCQHNVQFPSCFQKRKKIVTLCPGCVCLPPWKSSFHFCF